jgi:mono/diheme cytochrome c family protein
MRRTALALLLIASPGCVVRGCTSSRPPIHVVPNMDDQEKVQAQEASSFFYDGAAMRLPVEGTVARGELRADVAVETGKDAQGAFVTQSPVPVDDAVLARGLDRYGIYCAPCHTDSGNGKGILFERGKVPTTDLAVDKVLAMSDGQLFDTITNGFGLMPGYRWPLSVPDRWAIVAHVRVLQRERAAQAPPVAAAAEMAP